MKVILLEFADEARELLRRHGRELFSGCDTLVLCFHPSIRVFLKKLGIKTQDTISYLGNDTQHRVMLMTRELTDGLMQRLDLEDSLGIKDGYRQTCCHHLRMNINYFLSMIEIFNKVNEEHPLSDIYCCLPLDQSRMYQKKAALANAERFLGYMAFDFCRQNKINFHPSYVKVKRSSLMQGMSAWLLGKVAGSIASLEYKALLKKKAASETIIVPAISYNMGGILREIARRHPKARFIMVWETAPSPKQRLLAIYSILSNWMKKAKKENILDAVIPLDLIRLSPVNNARQEDKTKKMFDAVCGQIQGGLKNSFTYMGVPFYEYLAKKIQVGLKNETLLLQRNTLVLHQVFLRLEPRLLLSMYSRGIYYTMGDLSRLLNIPSMIISHGTHVPPNNEYEKIENYELGKSVTINTYQYVAVQTPWTKKFLDYYSDLRPRVVSGPLLYSRIKKDLRRKDRLAELGIETPSRILVHATTQKTRTGRRFHITETLDEYIASLADIVLAINGLDDVYFILRPHPACEISDREFLSLLPNSERFRIISSGPFADVLSLTDMLISYSSTCIEEALQEGIPVIMYDKWKRYNHFNLPETTDIRTLRKNPAYYMTDPALLCPAIRKILDLTGPGEPVFTEEEMAEYRYPREYRNNFFEFIHQKLGTQEIAK